MPASKPQFHFDPVEAIAHLRGSDPILGAVIDQVGPFVLEIKKTPSLFDALLHSIVYQQLHGKAAAAIHGRLLVELDRHGGTTPEALVKAPDSTLRGAGLSANKLLAARDLAEKCLKGIVPTLKEARRLNDDELVERLTEVRGIGPWTVHVLLIFYLGRPDVLPTGDFSVRLAFKNIYRKRRPPTPAAMIKHARRWQPYRSVASWYLWRFLDLE
jgi:DNA-3-methyladenine glycosylase II